MGLSLQAARELFAKGEFVPLVSASDGSERAYTLMPPAYRVLVANALALSGNLNEASKLAEFDRHPPSNPEIRAQAEWTFGLVCWRKGDIASALRHAQSAARLAAESGNSECVAWAHLHLFRIQIESGPLDSVTAALAEARRYASRAGLPPITAYLHNCVAVLEGQTGRLDEARRHLEISESLLRLAPNAWLTGSLHMHRGSIACALCKFDEAAEHFRLAKQATKNCGPNHAMAADSSLGYVHLLRGEFDRAKETLGRVIDNSDAASLKLAAIDSLARVHLALGDLAACENALSRVDQEVRLHPELASAYHVRWTTISHARLSMKKRRLIEALQWVARANEQASRVGDIPLLVASSFSTAQLLHAMGRPKESAASILGNLCWKPTSIRDLQAQYYYASGQTLRAIDGGLARQLQDRALRVGHSGDHIC
jgi:tetratricopeptide (TPR) repeat protein